MRFVEALEQAAWDRYTDATQRAARLSGTQPELFDTAQDERREWLGIHLACAIEVERLRHG